jgi:two-component system CheB/CheR fusion protein
MEIEQMDFHGFHKEEPIPEELPALKATQNIQSFANQLILNQFTPPSVLINQEGDILYITGRTGKYLEPAAGKANWNIFAMAREGLRNELLFAIRKAKQSYEPVHLRNIKIDTLGRDQFVDVTIQTTEKPLEFKDTIMIVFSDVNTPQLTEDKKSRSAKKTKSDHDNMLEIELQRSREELQNAHEEMQTSHEELKSANEELQSTNEELQSTNEELTTSKEEMQSMNEELQTVNLELQSKISDYIASYSDMKNLLNSTEIATLFLDKNLNIRRFTEQLTKNIK